MKIGISKFLTVVGLIRTKLWEKFCKYSLRREPVLKYEDLEDVTSAKR